MAIPELYRRNFQALLNAAADGNLEGAGQVDNECPVPASNSGNGAGATGRLNISP